MARHARFAQARFALWPDEELLGAVASLPGEWINILRTDLNHVRGSLTVDLADEFYRAPGSASWVQGPEGRPDPRQHSRLLRLTWASRWEGHIHLPNQVFALESYNEFYAGPYGTFHPMRQGLAQSWLYEVVNDPSPWITEMLEENDNTDVFPMYGVPVAVSQRERTLNPHLTPTGRFFPEDARPEDTCRGTDFLWPGSPPSTPAEWEERQAHFGQLWRTQWEAARRRPRYRHLLIASNTHLLEVLCEDLPTWEWVSGS